MKPSILIPAFLRVALLLVPFPAYSQIVADGATNTLANVTTNITGDVTVGTNGSFTLLVLSNNCLLTNSGFSTIGANATARSNEVRLVSPTARWFMGAGSANSLFLGSNSAFNRLVVSNGATAAGQGQAFLGYISASASNNQVWVTGSNSVWSSASSIEVGFLGSGNQVVVSNGGTVLSANAVVGASTITSNNLALVTGAGSVWSNAFTFSVGANGSGNRLLVSEGGVVRSSGLGRIGGELLSGSGNNLALITGSGSVWSNALDLEIGRSSGINNQLVVSNGASAFVGGNALLGASSGANSNSVLVTDPGTSWLVGNNLYVGSNGALSRLVVSNGATVAASNLFVSLNASSTNNRVVVDGGTLRVINAAGTSLLDVRSRGTNVLNAGLVEVDQLLVTNAVGAAFELNGGTLSARNMTINNGQFFRVPNGVSAATLHLVGNGIHAFANGLIVSTNGLLTGNGSIVGGGTATVSSGGTLSPGDSIGKIAFNLSSAPLLQGTVVMEISKNGSVLTNDVVQVGSALTYGGSLVVSKLGPTALASGNRFKLFNAPSYGGSFSSLTLPPLGSALNWTNKLLVDGSIEVIGLSVRTLPARSLSETSARLIGVANPGGQNARAWFEYGFTTNYDSVTPPQTVGSGNTDTIFSQGLSGLLTGVSYHFRAVASNSFGVAFGEDRNIQSFGSRTYLKASNSGGGDIFGIVVAISGDTLVTGSSSEDSNATGVNGDQNNNAETNSGAAYVFVRNGDSWVQQAYLKASNTGSGDSFGSSVAISGDTIIVGASGEDSNATGVNGNQNDNSSTNAGAAYVFVRSGTNWAQQAYLKASNTEPTNNLPAGDSFGTSVAVSGDTVVIGSLRESSNATGVNGDQNNNDETNSGAAYVFVRNGTTWSQQAYLKASNTEANDFFGGHVAISDETVVIGAFGEDSNATGVNGNQTSNNLPGSGAAYVFIRNGTTWTQQAYLKASNTGLSDSFGTSVSVSGDTIITGADGESSNATQVNGNQSDNSSPNSGAAYVFVRNGTTWTQQAYLKASNTDPFDHFGDAVAISGDTAIIGAIGEGSNATGVNGNQSDNSAGSSGAAYVFVRDGTNWTQQAYLKASNTEAGDAFGLSVGVSDEFVVVGADLEDSGATGVNGDQGNNSATNSGAAYVFGPPQLPPPLLSIAPSGISQITLSWTPPTPGFSLQETLTLSPVSWSNSPSDQTNPITLPVTAQTKFFRLFKP